MVDPQLLNEQLSARRTMLDELRQTLSRLDQLRLLQEGAHVAMAIDALERRLAKPAAAGNQNGWTTPPVTNRTSRK